MTNRYHARRFPAVFVVAALLWLTAEFARAQMPVQMQDILAQWQNKENNARSIRAEWTEQFTEYKGSLSKIMAEVAATGTAPPEDSSFRHSAKLLIDGDRISYRYQSHIWCLPKKKYVENDAIHVFDGRTTRRLTVGGTVDFPCGLIAESEKLDDVTSPVLRPILVSFRPTAPRMSPYQGMPFFLTGRKALIQGRVCDEVEVRRPRGTQHRLWVDVARECTVLRMIDYENNVITQKIEVRYVKSNDKGWVPEEWETSQYLRDQTLQRFYHAKVDLLEINPSFPNDTFKVIWPVGTFVLNETTREQFIQKENDKVRTIETDERQLPYEVLRNSPGRTHWARLLSWPVIAAAFLLTLAGVLLGIRILRRNNRKLSA